MATVLQDAADAVAAYYPVWLAKMGGRKFILAAFIVLATTGMRIFNMVDIATWERVCLWVLGLYGTANVSQKIGTKDEALDAKQDLLNLRREHTGNLGG